MGHSPRAPIYGPGPTPQQPQLADLALNERGFGRRYSVADSISVLLSDVVDLRSGTSIPLNVDEEIFMLTLAFPRQLYDDELANKLKKHHVFPMMLTTSGSVHDDHGRAYRIGTSFGLNMQEEPVKMGIKGMKELMKKTKVKEISFDNV